MILPLLKEKLGDCNFSEKSLCVHKSSYQHVYEKRFYIYDGKDTQPIKVVTNGDFQLTILNTSGNAVCVVKTDKCLIKDDIQKCDCILFDDRKLYFVEIKSSSNKSVRRREAVMQLGSTIKLLLEKGVDFTRLNAKAIICFKRDKEYPTISSNNSKRAMFEDEYNVILEEGNKIEF
jgi:hypothetical protein